MTGTAIAGDAVMASALVVIAVRELRRHRRPPRGQALAEMAITLAILLPLALAASQVALLLAYRLAQQQANGTIAAVAAADGPGASLDAVVASEAGRIACGSPVVTLATPEPGIVAVGLRCTWTAPVYTPATWPVSTSASAALPAPSPSPSPADSPSPGAS